MAKDNITPIYGEWLCKNIKYYQFSGKEAEDLKKKLESIDVSNMDYDDELVNCYRKFLQLFHNNMFEMAFCPPKEGITTTHIKAFLAPNAYGVMTPIEFLEENHSKIQYEFDEKIKEIQTLETNRPVDVDYKSIHEDVEKITKWKKSQFANVFRGILVIALVVFCIIQSIGVFDLLAHDDYQIIRIAITAVLILGAWKGLAEFFAGIRKKKYFKAVEICNSVFLSGANAPFGNNKDNSHLEEYKDLLQKAIMEGNPTELPGGAGKVAEKGNLNKYLKIVKKVTKKNKKIKKRAGIFTFLLLIAATYVLLYGYKDILLEQNEVTSGNQVDVLSSTPLPTPTEALKKVERTESLIPDDTLASSERVSSKGTVFGVDLTVDNDIETCWQDGVDGDGVDEWLTYTFDRAYNIDSISILNGRVISEEKYYANGRMKEVIVYFAKNDMLVYQMNVVLDDVFNEIQTIDLEGGIEADKIIIAVESIYQGTDYKDLCVTEVSFTHAYYEYE